MGIKIGFPRALFYFLYYPYWHTFFTELGCEVILSKPTNKLSLDLGVEEAVNDACLPIKIYHGHVAELKDKVDVLFIPRLVSVRKEKNETFCPKFLGLPDMIYNSMDNLPFIIEERIDLGRGMFPLWSTCNKIAKDLGFKGVNVWRAINKANNVQKRFNKYMLLGIDVEDAINYAIKGSDPGNYHGKDHDINLAILGYPYLIYDSFVNVNLYEKLSELGIKPWTVEMVSPQLLKQQGRYFKKDLFWYFSNRAIRAAFYYIHGQSVDGVVHVSAFGCGPDAMVDKLIELEAKNNNIPYLNLSLDEHTGDAGVFTRIEAFIDMLRYQRKNVKNGYIWGNICTKAGL